jgi:hypothetical protein
VKERSAGKLPIDHHVLSKAPTHVTHHATQQAATGVVLAILGAIGFHIQGQRQTGPYDADHDHFVVIAEDLPLPVPVGTTPAADLLAGARYARSIDGQPEEAAVVEGLVALGLADGRDRGTPGPLGAEPLGEVAEGVIPEARNLQRSAGERTG